MSPEYRRMLTRLLGTVYGGGALYAVLWVQSLSLVGVVVLLAALTYLSLGTASVLVERDWGRLLPPRRPRPELPPSGSVDATDGADGADGEGGQ